jgi:hypothetical protein
VLGGTEESHWTPTVKVVANLSNASHYGFEQLASIGNYRKLSVLYCSRALFRMMSKSYR